MDTGAAGAAGECGVLSRGALAERLAEAEQRLREMSAEYQRSLEELAASERRYRMLAENATDVVYAIDPSGMISWISPSVEEILGWLPADLIGKPLLEILNPDDLDRLSPRLVDLLATGASKGNVEMRYLDAAGAWRWMSVTGRVLRDEHGELVGGIEAARDIEAEVAARTALAESERQFRMAMEGSPEGMATVGLDRRVMSANTALCRLIGRPRGWLVERSVDDVVHPDDLMQDQLTRARLLAGAATERTDERRLLTADGGVVWVLHSIGLLRDADQRPLFFVSHFQDITSRKTTESQLHFAANHDPLTGLANRSHLVGEIQRALSSSRRSTRLTALLMMDLDHFKRVNDTLGHAAGDELLKEASRRLVRTVRDSDLVSRHGGDEFVIVMRDLGEATEAMRVADRVVEAFRLPFHLDGNELYTTATVGVAVSRGDSAVDGLLAEADAALYAAKEDGRNRSSLFNEELRAEVIERLQIESGLRRALEVGEFEVWYQPEFNLDDGRVSALEALLRWRRADGNVIPAKEFIEIAEDSGLIVDIGAVAIRAACLQVAQWAAAGGEPVVVRINLSARQLADRHLLALVDDAILQTGVVASSLSFEISEPAIVRDLPAVEANVLGLHERGIALVLDNFGDGFASLTSLRHYPVAVLKLDHALVRDVAVSEVDRRLVAGVVALAHSLGVEVVAEGVELEEQVVALRELGCRRAQGFVYSPAVPAHDLAAANRSQGDSPG